ncbi:MAG TPA: Asp-tRNA(Asn)/Glu-tRNA(Gln) amidotransferase subunit GatC [Halanaerobiales bacterium]|nr:Asp-tRNA(Asn)/Glu-tRNA(Gln) amidotransferase subunit GatC [Halanaerobiales bacterium]
MIEKEVLEHIAELAYLELDEEEKEIFTKQLGDILNYVEKLNEVDTEGVVPTAYTVPMENVFREDQVKPSMVREKVLANAPEKKEGQFRVPKIIGD